MKPPHKEGKKRIILEREDPQMPRAAPWKSLGKRTNSMPEARRAIEGRGNRGVTGYNCRKPSVQKP